MPQSDYDMAGGIIKVVGDGLGGILNIFYPGTGKQVGDAVGKIGDGVAGIDDMGQRKPRAFDNDSPSDAPVPEAKASPEVESYLSDGLPKASRDYSADGRSVSDWWEGKERNPRIEPDDESGRDGKTAPVPQEVEGEDDGDGEGQDYPMLGGRTPWLLQMFGKE